MKTMVMTGGSSGFGKITVNKLIADGNKIILGVRKKTSIKGCKVVKLNLTQLKSVRSFANTVINELGNSKIDALILNAGISYPTSENRTQDGYEAMFGVNHLAHYLLLRLLIPSMNKGGVIILTTSGTHNPSEKTIVPPPRHAKANLLAFPEKDPNKHKNEKDAGGHAYSSSKLCNLLTARAINSHLTKNDLNINAIAFDPGPIPGTDLSRNNSLVIRIIWKILSFPLFRAMLPKLSSKKTAGNILADIALGTIKSKNGNVYIALRKGKITYPLPSELALNNDAMEKLWVDSAQLVGLNI